MKLSHLFGRTLESRAWMIVFNIAAGLLSLAVVSYLYHFILKYDYDALFLSYSNSLTKLEEIRKSVNQAQNISLNAENGEQIEFIKTQILTQWNTYKTLQNEFLEMQDLSNFILKIYHFLDDNKELKAQRDSLQKMLNRLDVELKNYLQNLQDKQAVSALNQAISSMVYANLQFVAIKQARNNATHTILQKAIIIIMCLIMIVTMSLSFLILRNIKSLHTTLESKVQEKTKELQNLNNSLKATIDKEVLESRKKDQIMYQQARLASMGEMIGNIAHQWRQPLNALMLLIQAFKIKAHNGKLTQEFVDIQVNEGLKIAKKMSQTIEDFRNFFNTTSSKESFNLKENIKDSISLVDAFLKQNEISISVDCSDNLELVGFKSAFSQVLLNLIKNAEDVLKERNITPAKIKITAEATCDFVKILFMDNGGGIRLTDIQKIFEPYFTTKHKSVGTGIGLYMSKQIIEKQMQGSIEVRNVCYDNAFNVVCAGGDCARECALKEGMIGAQFIIMIPQKVES
ncbi:MAG: HAMP domain-containing sensor histidine kinase [Helicobacteraceae bacterium]|nr:HAMP domain-containing sensor histidine kinase [Helicobacteraceae bacterium]